MPQQLLPFEPSQNVENTMRFRKGLLQYYSHDYGNNSMTKHLLNGYLDEFAKYKLKLWSMQDGEGGVFKGKEGMQEVKGGPSIGRHPFFCWSKRLRKK